MEIPCLYYLNIASYVKCHSRYRLQFEWLCPAFDLNYKFHSQILLRVIFFLSVIIFTWLRLNNEKKIVLIIIALGFKKKKKRNWKVKRFIRNFVAAFFLPQQPSPGRNFLTVLSGPRLEKSVIIIPRIQQLSHTTAMPVRYKWTS